MVNVIVAFPQLENGKKIKSILAKHGIQACAVCTTGAQTLQHTDALGDGLVICAGRLLDMRYTQLLEYMPETFEMLAMLPPESCMEKEADRVVCLSMPLKVHELVSTVEMICCSIARRKKKKKAKPKERSPKEQKLLTEAKKLLMARNHMTEEEAHRYIQKCSMDSGTGLVETAQMIVSLMQQ